MRKLIFASSLLILLSCNSNIFYEQTVAFPENIWQYENVAHFEFNIQDTTRRYDLILDVDHSVDFRFENNYVKIHTTFPEGNKTEDQVSLELTDNLDQWQGDCNSKKCVVSILLQENVYFNQTGLYQIDIEQYNRVDSLTGMNSLTLMLEKRS